MNHILYYVFYFGIIAIAFLKHSAGLVVYYARGTSLLIRLIALRIVALGDTHDHVQRSCTLRRDKKGRHSHFPLRNPDFAQCTVHNSSSTTLWHPSRCGISCRTPSISFGGRRRNTHLLIHRIDTHSFFTGSCQGDPLMCGGIKI